MASVTNPLDLGNPLPLTEANQPASASFLSRPVAWFRGEGLEGKEKLFRTIAAIACAILLSLTVVGGIFVVLGAIEWTRQDQEFSKKQEEKITAEAAKILAAKQAAEAAEAAKALATKKAAAEEAEAAKALAAKQAAEAAEAAKALAAKQAAAEEAEAAKALVAKQAAEVAEAANALAAKIAAEEAEVAKALAAKKAAEAAEAAKALAAKQAAEAEEAAKALAAKQAAEAEEAAKALAPAAPAILSPKPQLSSPEFPEPFETVKLFAPEALLKKDEILQKVSQGLKKGKNTIVPQAYFELQASIKSQEKLAGLYEEAKILAHLATMRDFDGLIPSASQYNMILYTNLDDLVRCFVKHKCFPQDPSKYAQ